MAPSPSSLPFCKESVTGVLFSSVCVRVCVCVCVCVCVLNQVNWVLLRYGSL